MSFRPKSDESLKSPLGTLASEIAIPTAGFDKGWPERPSGGNSSLTINMNIMVDFFWWAFKVRRRIGSIGPSLTSPLGALE